MKSKVFIVNNRPRSEQQLRQAQRPRDIVATRIAGSDWRKGRWVGAQPGHQEMEALSVLQYMSDIMLEDILEALKLCG